MDLCLRLTKLDRQAFNALFIGVGNRQHFIGKSAPHNPFIDLPQLPFDLDQRSQRWHGQPQRIQRFFLFTGRDDEITRNIHVIQLEDLRFSPGIQVHRSADGLP